MLHIREKHCFEMLPTKVDSLVIVNPNFLDYSSLKIVTETAKNFAEIFTVVFPVEKRLMYVMQHIYYDDVRIDDQLLVLCLLQNHTEFVILRKISHAFFPIIRKLEQINDLNQIFQKHRLDFITVIFNAE